MTKAETLYNKYKTLFNKNNINTPLRLANFFGQAEIESDIQPKSENLNYSVDGLLNGFGRHRISEADAKKYGRTSTQKANQKEIANRIYGGAWGKEYLGNTQPNDGNAFIGKGIFQITGRSNYEKLSKETGIDFVNKPELLLEEANSLIAAIWFWNSRNLNKYADNNDTLSISKSINLGSANSKNIPKHAKERQEAVEKYKKIFK